MNDLPPGRSDVSGPTDGAESESGELLGATDIVDAFTALRHELKLQVRNGRDLQQAFEARLQRVEAQTNRRQAASDGTTSDDLRMLATAVAEMDESLQRFVDMTGDENSPPDEREPLTDRFDRIVADASWLARTMSSRLLGELRAIVDHADDQNVAIDGAADTVCQGLRLLHERVQRLMQQCEIERVDVLHQPFDPEQMHAVDVVESTSVPSSHVAEQLRPGYRCRGKILRCADVRIAR